MQYEAGMASSELPTRVSTFGGSVKFYETMTQCQGELKSYADKQCVLEEEFQRLLRQQDDLKKEEINSRAPISSEVPSGANGEINKRNSLNYYANPGVEEDRIRSRNNAILSKIRDLETVFVARSEKLRVMRDEYEDLVRKHRFKSENLPASALTRDHPPHPIKVYRGETKVPGAIITTTSTGVNTEISGPVVPQAGTNIVSSGGGGNGWSGRERERETSLATPTNNEMKNFWNNSRVNPTSYNSGIYSGLIDSRPVQNGTNGNIIQTQGSKAQELLKGVFDLSSTSDSDTSIPHHRTPRRSSYNNLDTSSNSTSASFLLKGDLKCGEKVEKVVGESLGKKKSRRRPEKDIDEVDEELESESTTVTESLLDLEVNLPPSTASKSTKLRKLGSNLIFDWGPGAAGGGINSEAILEEEGNEDEDLVEEKEMINEVAGGGGGQGNEPSHSPENLESQDDASSFKQEPEEIEVEAEQDDLRGLDEVAGDLHNRINIGKGATKLISLLEQKKNGLGFEENEKDAGKQPAQSSSFDVLWKDRGLDFTIEKEVSESGLLASESRNELAKDQDLNQESSLKGQKVEEAEEEEEKPSEPEKKQARRVRLKLDYGDSSEETSEGEPRIANKIVNGKKSSNLDQKLSPPKKSVGLMDGGVAEELDDDESDHFFD